MTNEPEIVDEHILEVLADVRSGNWDEIEQLRWIKVMLRDAWAESLDSVRGIIGAYAEEGVWALAEVVKLTPNPYA